MLERAAESQYPRGVVLELILLGAVQNLAAGRARRTAARHRAGARPPLPRQRDDRGTGLRRGLADRAAAGARLHAVLLAALIARCRCTSRRRPRAACSSCAARRCAPGSSRPSPPGSSACSAAAAPWCTRRARRRDGTLAARVRRARPGRQLEIALAQRATHAYSEDGDLQVITLFDGERFEGIPGERNSASCVSPRTPSRCACRRCPVARWSLEGVPDPQSAALARIREQLAELHWRIAFPSWRWCWPASPCRWRGCGRARAAMRASGYAVLIFFVYISLTIAGRKGLARGAIPAVVRPVVGARASWCCSRRDPARATPGVRDARYRRNTARRGLRRRCRHEPARSLRDPRRARRRVRRARGAGRARRAVPVREPAGRHRRRHLHRRSTPSGSCCSTCRSRSTSSCPSAC